MKNASWVVFHRLTSADFYETSKPRVPGAKGGKQSYIDLAGNSVPLADWETGFFNGIIPTHETQGPAWDISLSSLRISRSQPVRIASRTSSNGKYRNISIRSQKIHSREANRVFAWHPNHSSFPDLPAGAANAQDSRIAPLIVDLVIYIIRTDAGDFWAGWFQRSSPDPSWVVDPRLQVMFTDNEGHIELDPTIDFDEGVADWPFQNSATGATTPTVASPPSTPATPASTKPAAAPQKPSKTKTLAPKTYKPLSQEEATKLLIEDDMINSSPEIKEATRQTRVRNQKAVRILKGLYGECQISGNKFVFEKSDGMPYLEVHHLIPLGEGGADAPANLVVLSAHIHRMLHYASVSEIDLSQVKESKLKILINGDPYTITWNPEHAKLVNDANSD